MTEEILAILSTALPMLSKVITPSEYDVLAKRIEAARETYNAQRAKLLEAVADSDATAVNAIISSLL